MMLSELNTVLYKLFSQIPSELKHEIMFAYFQHRRVVFEYIGQIGIGTIKEP